jgi:hypothetical protein
MHALVCNCQCGGIRTVLQFGPVLVDLADVNNQRGHAEQNSGADQYRD